jgi:hypothetical protein
MEKVDILDSKTICLDLTDAVEKIEAFVADSSKHFVVFPAVHTVLLARKDGELRAAHNAADLALADGMPLVWASKLLGNPLPQRVTGLDLLPKFSRVAARKGYTFFLMGDLQPSRVLKVPPGVAHGCKTVQGPVNLLYITSHVYNSNDEIRLPHDEPEIRFDWLKGPPIK